MDELFDPEKGCQFIGSWVVEDERGQFQLNGVTVHIAKRPDPEAANAVAPQYTKDPLIPYVNGALRGWSFGRITLGMTSLDLFISPSMFRYNVFFNPEFLDEFPTDRGEAIGSMGSFDATMDVTASCEAMLPYHIFDSTTRQQCQDLAFAMGEISREDSAPAFYRKEESAPGIKGATYVAHLPLAGPNRQAFLNLVAVNGTIMSRALWVAGANGDTIRLELSPTQAIVGGILKQYRISAPGSVHSLEKTEALFDGQWRRLWTGTKQLVPKDRLTDNSLLPPSILATDLAQPVEEKMASIMHENSINTASSGLMRRLELPPVDRLEPDTSPSSAQRIARLKLQSGQSSHEHGNVVASILAADLPNLKIHVVGLEEFDLHTEPQVYQQYMTTLLATTGARVVNISQAIPRWATQCETIFSPLFRAHEQTVLFVVAAGNFGTENAIGACPASLTTHHPNVLTVAGYQHRGELHPRSNFGGLLVDVAGPWNVPAVYLAEGYDGAKEEVLDQCGGTSCTAPWVSNIALKLLAQNSKLTAPDLARTICSTHSGPALQVRCGAAIDRAALLHKFAPFKRW